MEARQALVLATYDRMNGLVLEDVSIDCYITITRCDGEMTGRNPVNWDKQGRMCRSSMVQGFRPSRSRHRP